jgi:hypothetical protein
MSLYVITNPERPWSALFTSADPGEIAAAVHAQPASQLAIYVSHDGAAVGLGDADRQALSAALGESYALEVVQVRGRAWTVAAPVDLAA